MVLQNKETGAEFRLMSHTNIALPKYIDAVTTVGIQGDASTCSRIHFGHSKEYLWFNGLNTAVYLKYRDGTTVIIPSAPKFHDEFTHLSCRVHTHGANNANQISHESVNDTGFDYEGCSPGYVVAGGLKTYTRPSPTKTTVDLTRNATHICKVMTDLTVDYQFFAHELRGQYGVYVKDLDVVITLTAEACKETAHPYNHHGILLRNLPIPEKDTLSANIYIVDNIGAVGDRYCMVLGKIYEIPKIKDPEQRDGVYLSRAATAVERHAEHIALVEWRSFEDAEEQRIIFTSREVHLTHEEQLRAAKLAAEIEVLRSKPVLDKKDIEAKRADTEARRAEGEKKLAEAAKQDLRRTIIDWAKLGMSLVTFVLGFVLKAKFANSSS